MTAKGCAEFRSTKTNDIQYASDTFTSLVKEGPNYVCTCCHQEENYLKLLQTSATIFDTQYIRRSGDQEMWVCQTCHRTLKRGKMPAQAKANKLDLTVIPPELSDLNELETRPSLRIPFIKRSSRLVPAGKTRSLGLPSMCVQTSSRFAVSFRVCLRKLNWSP